MTTDEAAVAVAAGGLIGAMIAVYVIIALVIYVVEVIAMWKIFTKAGKAGWRSIIPILNVYDMFDLSWSSTMGLVVVIGTVVGCICMALANSVGVLGVIGIIIVLAIAVLQIIDCVKLAKVFGKGGGFAVGLIFFPFIFHLILGFGSAEYIGKDE